MLPPILLVCWFKYPGLPPPSGELSEDVEAASETTTDQEDQTKDRESGGEKELTKGTGKANIQSPFFWGSTI